MLTTRSRGGGAQIRALRPIAWYRWGIGITTATGVSNWADQSGNGHDLAQGTGASQPALQADGSILFDGSSDYLKTAGFTLPQPVSVYLLFKQVSWTGDDYVWDGSGQNDCGIRQHTASPQLVMNAGTDGITSPANTPALNAYAAIGAVYNGASSALQINQSAQTTGSVGTNAMGGFTIGVRGDVTTIFGNIQVKEAIIFPVAHDATTVSMVNQYLQNLGGL